MMALAVMSLLSGCNNPCQALCADIAQYARECGYDSTAEDMQACRDDFATSALAEGQQLECLEVSDPQQLREWWTCEELLENYQSASP
ncbi:MAG: hypothetical protein Q8P18_30290 [Pseudomonadota bacterium]|nr:hypothetical protein [Pseudomonadota bacterium]